MQNLTENQLTDLNNETAVKKNWIKPEAKILDIDAGADAAPDSGDDFSS